LNLLFENIVFSLICKKKPFRIRKGRESGYGSQKDPDPKEDLDPKKIPIRKGSGFEMTLTVEAGSESYVTRHAGSGSKTIVSDP